jgi:hypothetical protein
MRVVGEGKEYNEWGIRVVGVGHGSARSGTKEWTIFTEWVWNIYGAEFKKNIIRGCFWNVFRVFSDNILFMVQTPFKSALECLRLLENT